MKNIFLSDKLSNYSVDIHANAVRWELPNVEFRPNSTIALKSFLVLLKKPQQNSGIFQITTNLIDRNTFNSEGVFLDSLPVRSKLYYDPQNIIHWTVDYQRPRVFVFTLYGINVSNINHIRFIIQISEHASGALVCF